MIASPPVARTAFRLISIRREDDGQPFVDRVEMWDRSGRVLLRSSRPVSVETLVVPLMVQFSFDEHQDPFTLARGREQAPDGWKERYAGNTLLPLTGNAPRR